MPQIKLFWYVLGTRVGPSVCLLRCSLRFFLSCFLFFIESENKNHSNASAVVETKMLKPFFFLVRSYLKNCSIRTSIPAIFPVDKRLFTTVRGPIETTIFEPLPHHATDAS